VLPTFCGFIVEKLIDTFVCYVPVRVNDVKLMRNTLRQHVFVYTQDWL